MSGTETADAPSDRLPPAPSWNSSGTTGAIRSDKGGVLRSLQAGRGIAAFGVLMHHAGFATKVFVAPVPAWLAEVLHRGFLGVDFFFVLSGFIILNAHFDDPGTLGGLRRYAFKRATRIYLPYLPVSAVLIASYLLMPDLSGADRNWGWWTSLLLLPSASPPALAVGWTLVHEVLFYVVFALYFLDRRIFSVAVMGWGTALLIHPMMAAQAAEPLPTALLNPINLEFCIGLACACGYRAIDRRFGPALIAIGVGAVLFFFIRLGDEERLVFALGAALIILGLALQERTWGAFIPAALVGLGDASYAIYLVHTPLVSLTSRAAAHLPLLHNWCAGLLLSISCAVLAGCGYHYLYERRVLRAARKWAYRRDHAHRSDVKPPTCGSATPA